ncbi:MAG: glycosyltransferase [Solirubrobacteraceae bacterium]
MRVLSIFPRLDPAGGGIQSGGMNMVLASRRAGVEHVVCCTEEHSARGRAQVMVDELAAVGIPVISFRPLERLPAQLATRWSISPAQVPWIVRHAGEFDVIHVHGVWNIGALTGLTSSRLHPIPIVVTPHESMTNTDIDVSRSRPRRAQKLALKALYIRWADLFVVTSQLETSESLPPQAPSETIPYPLFDARRPPADLPSRSTRPELWIGFLGRVAAKKNLSLIIESLALLAPNVRLLVAGDGPADIVEPARERAAELAVTERIEWLGFVPPEDRDAFLARIDVLAMPSAFESFGMAAAEAMLAGVPTIVSERTGISELISRHGGGAVIHATPEALAAAVAEYDRDRDRLAALGLEARGAIQAELDYDRIGERLRSAYIRAVATQPGPRRGGVARPRAVVRDGAVADGHDRTPSATA